jgi:predicted AAA+ superfamily ATPase
LEAKYYLSHSLNNKKPGIDFIISNAVNNKIVGINIKYSNNIADDDFQVFINLKETIGKQLQKGIVFYLGNEVIIHTKDIIALPLTLLWGESYE